MKAKTIIFDFDGTIANTVASMLQIYNRVAPKYGCKPIPPENYDFLMTQRPQDAMKAYGVTRWKLPFLAFEIRRKLVYEMAKTEPMPGMIEALEAIKNAGYDLGILTSNAEKNVNIFLKNYNIQELFNFVYAGSSLFNKAETFRKVLKKEKLEKNNILYVGDETRDIEATQKVGVPIIAVSWGLNSHEALEKLKPLKTVNTAENLVEAIVNGLE